MPDPADQTAIIAFLSQPATYGLTDGTVERIETHGAIVFLAGDRAYKLKRAVKYPYMDYSTAERRHAMCVRELEINRRMAPQIYLEVRAIVRQPDDSLGFAAADAADAPDCVVVMRRFAQDTLFGRLCDAGRLTPERMRELADTLAAFHAHAEPTPEFGGSEGLAAVVRGDNAILNSMSGAPFAVAALDDFSKASKAALAVISPILDRRRDAGAVRRCHGDLHLNNVCLIDDKPVLFDAIEFEDAFACIDTLYDLAFLLMDLDRHKARALANVLLNRYLECTLDYDGLEALPLFLACRAAIRAHVSVSRANATEKNHATELDEAEAYLDLARSYLRPSQPRLVAVGGLSGTGKTTLARAIASDIGLAPGAVILRSDVTRKRLMGVSETTRLPEGAYSPETNRNVFSEMADLAARILATGHAVIMDAVYGTAEERDEIAKVAQTAGVTFSGLWLQADPQILTSRIAGRRGDASDATMAVLQKQLGAIKEPDDWIVIDAGGAPDTIAKAAAARLNPDATRGRS